MQMSHRKSTTKRNILIRSPHIRRNGVQPQDAATPATEKNLDLVLESARAEYQGVVYNTWATQSAKLHTYLWLSVAIISAEGALFLNVLQEHTPHTCVLCLGFLAICVAFMSFCLGVDAMRSRIDTMRPVYGDDYSYAIQVAEADGTALLLRKETIEALGNCIKLQISAVDFLGKRMRLLSKMLLLSSLLGAAAFACYALPQIFPC